MRTREYGVVAAIMLAVTMPALANPPQPKPICCICSGCSDLSVNAPSSPAQSFACIEALPTFAPTTDSVCTEICSSCTSIVEAEGSCDLQAACRPVAAPAMSHVLLAGLGLLLAGGGWYSVHVGAPEHR